MPANDRRHLVPQAVGETYRCRAALLRERVLALGGRGLARTTLSAFGARSRCVACGLSVACQGECCSNATHSGERHVDSCSDSETVGGVERSWISELALTMRAARDGKAKFGMAGETRVAVRWNLFSRCCLAAR